MSKIGHYCVCGKNLMKKYWKRFWKCFFYYLNKTFHYIAMQFQVLRFKSANQKSESLGLYYKDNGKLSDLTGFVNKEPSVDLSIIIPVYNVEKYIEDCLNSVLQQNTKYTVEIIIVNDGSKDNTVDKIQPFLKDARIRFFSQQNAGQSVARNRALYESKGKYIMCVDGDDILIDGTIERLMDVAISTNSDIAEGKVCRFYTGGETNLPQSVGKGGKIKIKSNRINGKFLLNCVGFSVAKVFKRELWQTLRYPEGYIYEDVITKFILRRKANQVAFIDEVVYAYRWSSGSSSHSRNKLKPLDSIWVFSRIQQLCEKEQVQNDNIYYLLSLHHIGLLNFITVSGQDEEVQQACFVEIKKQLISISDYRPRRLPRMFKALEKSILKGSLQDWKNVANVIIKFDFLLKYREIN